LGGAGGLAGLGAVQAVGASRASNSIHTVHSRTILIVEHNIREHTVGHTAPKRQIQPHRTISTIVQRPTPRTLRQTRIALMINQTTKEPISTVGHTDPIHNIGEVRRRTLLDTRVIHTEAVGVGGGVAVGDALVGGGVGVAA
jgi:hypothetical protein